MSSRHNNPFYAATSGGSSSSSAAAYAGGYGDVEDPFGGGAAPDGTGLIIDLVKRGANELSIEERKARIPILKDCMSGSHEPTEEHQSNTQRSMNRAAIHQINIVDTFFAYKLLTSLALVSPQACSNHTELINWGVHEKLMLMTGGEKRDKRKYDEATAEKLILEAYKKLFAATRDVLVAGAYEKYPDNMNTMFLEKGRDKLVSALQEAKNDL
jgi:hypothetical protein